jgi:hypothetical protein
MNLTQYLWSLFLLYPNAVKALDEVVQHVCLLAGLNGEMVTAGIPVTCSSRGSQTSEKRKTLMILPPLDYFSLQSLSFCSRKPVRILASKSKHKHHAAQKGAHCLFKLLPVQQ